jgi:hypothetical protein
MAISEAPIPSPFATMSTYSNIVDTKEGQARISIMSRCGSIAPFQLKQSINPLGH